MKTIIHSISFSLIMAVPLLLDPTYAQFYEYNPDDPGEYAPIREGEKAVIPLDTKDPPYC